MLGILMAICCVHRVLPSLSPAPLALALFLFLPQILANMYLVRSNFIDLMGLPQSM